MHSNTLKNLGYVPAFAVLGATAVMAADFQKGLEAFNNEDYETALEEWMPLAAVGDLNAMYNVGLLYDEGLGVEENKATALEWYLPPAQDGDVSAQFNVATIYDFGEGVPEDNGKALYWYTAAAMQADEQAQFNLGVMYANGEGVPVDYEESAMPRRSTTSLICTIQVP
jgi:TPR repeat protein